VKTLLTGASGFVGQHFVAHFPSVALGAGLAPDIRDFVALRKALSGCGDFDCVLHLAAQSSVTRSFRDPRETLETNLLGTLNLLLALQDIGFEGTLLYVSSAEVYGAVAPELLPVDEQTPLTPGSPYGVSKVAAETLCRQWSRTAKFRIVIVRPFNHIGPGQNAHFVVANFARQISAIQRGEQPPRVTAGDLSVTRDFLDVRDVIRAYQLLLKGNDPGETFNVCSGKERSISSILHTMLAIAEIDATVISSGELLRPFEQKRMVGKNAKLIASTGWRPSIPFDQTLRDILAQFSRSD
jgi:GDP-4-dehydro-6-deoxy-D-mannose reductase